MAATTSPVQPMEQSVDKGLKSGALGLISTTVIATAPPAVPRQPDVRGCASDS